MLDITQAEWSGRLQGGMPQQAAEAASCTTCPPSADLLRRLLPIIRAHRSPPAPFPAPSPAASPSMAPHAPPLHPLTLLHGSAPLGCPSTGC
jgi:hypothetical protein